MGLDLTLLVLTHDSADFTDDHPDWGFSHTMLELDRNGIAGLVAGSGLPTTPVPKTFTTYTARGNGEPYYGDTQTDPYGGPVRCVTCEQLAPLVGSPLVTDSDVNRAAWAYLAALNPATRVALYYH